VGAVQSFLVYLSNCTAVAAKEVAEAPFSWNEYFHFAIPISVLAMEVYVIWKMAQESSERSHTIAEFREMATHSRRAEYMLNLATAIRETKLEARFTSATMEVSSRSQGQRTIIETVKWRIKSGPYRHRGLIAKTQRTLPGAMELALRAPHVELRLSEVVALSRLRFFVRDRQESILGVAEGQPDLADAKESTQSARVHSRMLAEALERLFDTLWESATPIGTYFDELLGAATPITKCEVRTWFSAVDCKSQELDQVLAKNSSVYATLAEDPATTGEKQTTQESPSGEP